MTTQTTGREPDEAEGRPRQEIFRQATGDTGFEVKAITVYNQIEPGNLEDLKRAEAPKGRPTVVCLCGSTRFMDAFQQANLEETIAGRIVLSVGCNTKSDSDLIALGKLTEEAKAALDELHKRKIDLADEILILNVGGYVGSSTKSEIEYAKAKGKRLRWLEAHLESKLAEAPKGRPKRPEEIYARKLLRRGKSK